MHIDEKDNQRAQFTTCLHTAKGKVSGVFYSCVCPAVCPTGDSHLEGAEAEISRQGAGPAGGAGQLLRTAAPAEEQSLLPHPGYTHSHVHAQIINSEPRGQALKVAETHKKDIN